MIDWAVLSGDSERRGEAQRGMAKLISENHRGVLIFGDLPDGRFPSVYGEVKTFFESLKQSTQPDLIFCHEREDRHQDHRIVNEMVWSTFRDQVVLEYEVPKWDGGLGQPNVYVAVSAEDVTSKVDALMQVYDSQSSRDWFTPDTFMAILRLRGVECRSASGYAEAFYGRKLRISASGRDAV